MLTHWTLTYRTAEEEVNHGPLLDALAELSRQEGAVIVLRDAHAVVVLDIAPDGTEVDTRACAYVYDGQDTDGTDFYRCTTHDELTIGEPPVCAGYKAAPYADPALDAVREMPDPRDDALDRIADALRTLWVDGRAMQDAEAVESVRATVAGTGREVPA